MKKCPYCGHEQDDQQKCCEKCHAGLPAEKKTEVKPLKKKTNKESE